MTRYHINEKDEIVKCKVRFRKCKFNDFESKKEAHEALFLKKASIKYENDQKYVREKFSMVDPSRSFCTVDFSGLKPKKSVRKYMNELEKEFYSKGKTPDFFFCNSQIIQSNISYNRSHQRVHIRRIPTSDYENAIITSRWRLEVSSSGNFPTEKVDYELDLHNSFENELLRARSIISETILANSEIITVEELEAETDFMIYQLATAYTTIEELDPYSHNAVFKTWVNAENYGSFAKSDLNNLTVNVNYQNSSFNPRIFNEFLHGNHYYEAIFPENIDIRVYDDEYGASSNSWTIRLHKGTWKIFVTINEKMHGEEIKNAEHAYTIIKDFVKNYMLTNNDETVEEKSIFVRNLVAGIDDSINLFINKRKQY